jgi:benzoyl-CoA reductase/2-hydroxyglutaryl-CoA dehydratase subunit BcrC/BadD/HgdB
MCIALGLLDESSVQEISNLPIQDLQALAARLKEAIETQERRKKVLNEAMRLRFEGIARAKLNQEGKDTGTVRFQEGNTTVVANFRKKVDWDQDILANILAEYPEYKTDVKCVLSLEERKYNNWPMSIQKIFEPARSVKVSGYDFTFNDSEEA